MIVNKVELGLLANIKTGKLDANASADGGKYPFFTCSKQPLRIDDYSFDGNYVLVAGNGDLNVKHYVGKFDAYQRTYAIQTDQDKLYPRYLYYFLSKYVEVLRNLSIGGVIKYIKLGNLTGAKIPLPPLEEQKKIAAILDAADALRQKDAQLIAKYNALSQSLFLDMFGDPVTNLMEWAEKRLSDVCTKITDGTHKTPKYVEDGILFLSAKNIKKNQLVFESVKYLTTEEHNLLSKRCNVEKGDILITKSGSIGMAAIVDIDTTFSIFESLALIKYIRNSIDGKFLLYFMNTASTQHQYARHTKGVGVKHLHLTDLRKLKIILPPITLQNQFAERIQHIEAQKQQAQAALQKSGDLFNSLLQRAFKGELTEHHL